jgi:hypothetical protein
MKLDSCPPGQELKIPRHQGSLALVGAGKIAITKCWSPIRNCQLDFGVRNLEKMLAAPVFADLREGCLVSPRKYARKSTFFQFTSTPARASGPHIIGRAAAT